MIVYGAAFGNVMEGVGYHYSWTGQYFQDESFLSYLLNPFAVMCGVLSLSLAMHQGGTMLMMRGEEPIYGRARKAAIGGAIVAAVLFVIGGVWVAHLNGYAFTSAVDPNMPATPLNGPTVAVQAGAWMNNYHSLPHPVGAAGAGLRGHAGRRADERGAQAGGGLVVRRRGLDRRHLHGGGQHVPLPDAVHDQPEPEPDRVERLGQRL